MQTRARFFAEFQFLTNRRNDVIELDFIVFCEIPKVVKVARLVSGCIGECDRFFGGDLVEGINENGSVFEKVGELRIAAKDRPLFERESEHFVDRDIHFHVIASGKRPGISEVEGVGVDAHARVLPIEGEDDTRFFLNLCVHAFEARTNVFEGQRFEQGEVKIFGEAVIGKVAAFECGASLECKYGMEIGFGECVQKPGKAVIPFEDVFANPQSSGSRETIGKQGDVSLWNHSSAPHS